MMNRIIKGEKGCFASDSEVQLPDGKVKSIEALTPGDIVIGFDNVGNLVETEVLEVREHRNEHYREYTFWKNTVCVTDNHWILNQFNAFTEVGNLTKEDAAIDVNGHLIPLYKKSDNRLQGTVYSVITDNGTIVVNKIRFHNGGLGLEPHIEAKKGGGGGGGKGGGGSSQRTPIESPNTLRSKNIVRIVDLISEGEIVGLVDGLKSVYFDGTPLQNSNGSFNFSGVTVETRDGLPDQSHIAGFPQVESEIGVGSEVTFGFPITRTINETNVDAVIVKLQIPALSFLDVNTGDVRENSVSIKIEVKSNGGVFEQKVLDNIYGKCTSSYERAYRIELTGSAPWDIKFTRLSQDDPTSNVQSKTYWSSFTTVIDAKLTYPDCALVALTADAEVFGSKVPSRSYEVYGLICHIPSNYNPITRVYTGIWDGTFTTAWTDNPAWVYYELLINRRFGLGEYVSGYYVDKWALYEISKYCDELVSDGKGGLEPRLRFNGILNTQQDAYRVLNTLASMFYSMLYWGAGVVTVVQDAPSDPVKLVTPANVIDGLINYSGSSLKARQTVALVSWNDPNDDYRSAIEVVEDAESIRRYGYKPIEVVAFGCTSRSQAQRYGKWLLDTNKNSTETVSYKASFDHIDLRPGDIIAIADPAYAGARLGGRLKSATTTELELDSVPTEDIGDNKVIWAVLPTGEVVQKDVISISGSVVTLSSALAEAPQAGSMWVLGASFAEPRLFRVLSISEVDKNIYEVTALQHDPNKYDRIEKDIYVPETNYSVFPTGVIQPPSNLTVREYLYRNGVAVKSAVDLSYSASGDVRAKYYESQILRPDYFEWQPIDFTSLLTVSYQDTTNGNYQFRVRAVSAIGVKSEWVTQSFKLNALLAPPSDVEELKVSVSGGQLYLDWDAVPDLDVDFYEIKYSPAPTGVTWGSSQLLTQVKSTNLTLPAKNGSYLIKAVDTSGIYSVNPTMSIVGIAEISNVNIVEEIREDPTWPGTRIDVSAADGVLRLNSNTLLGEWDHLYNIPSLGYGMSGIESFGIYTASETVDLGSIFPCSISSDVRVYGDNVSNVIGTWVSLESVEELSPSSDSSLWSIDLQIRKSLDNVGWSEWESFYVGEHTARLFQFRLLMYSLNLSITPVVTKMLITIDMPDRTDSGSDLNCPSGGLRVNFSPHFAAKPSIATNVQGATGGEYCVTSNVSETGFDIQFFSNNTNLPVSRVFDYIAHGYGRKV